jgi:hypothetical protein
MAISYATQIRPLFTDVDIDHMSFFCDLSSYADVKANAADILGRLKALTGDVMPPPSTGGPWPPVQIGLFEQWIAEGCQP